MSEYHARLSPSAAHRWLTCTASVRMEQSVIAPPGDSSYAAEGTRAHEIAAIEASRAFGLINDELYRAQRRAWESSVDAEQTAEMIKHALAYVEVLQEQFAQHKHSQIMLEQRVSTGVTGCWGTADAIIVSPTHVHVVDYKYGMGIPVNAHENEQLMLYGLGALDEYGDVLGETEDVCMTIHQPRLDSVSTSSMPSADLRQWRESYVKPRAEEAMGEHGRFVPSETACRFCPAAGECKPRMMKFARMDFGDPDLMTPDDLADSLSRISELRDWCSAVESLSLDKAYSQGVRLPGWKVIRSGGRRRITNTEAAVRVLGEHGFSEHEVAETRLKTLGDLERIVGPKVLPEVLGGLITKSEGRPALVPETDKRAAIDPEGEAVQDFTAQPQ